MLPLGVRMVVEEEALSGMFRVQLGYFECARYLATRKILENY
jgi:hypothetical protein